MKVYFSVLILLGSIQTSICQLIELQKLSDSTYNLPARNLYLDFQNANFVKDNEYFNDIVEGYTLIGFWIEPRAIYAISEKSSISIGTNILKFSGKDGFYNIKPVFAFRQALSENVKLVLGSLDFNENHKMPSPILDPERFYFSYTENGAQFLLNSKSFESDIWVSWDNFIWYDDSVQEKITAGVSGKYALLKSDEFSINIPIYSIITHLGGQINRPKKPIETLVNFGSGLSIEYNDIGGFVRKMTFNPYFFIYKKNSSFASRPYNNGWAIYPYATLDFKKSLINIGWWYSNKFISPRGEAMYQTISTVASGYIIKNSSIITAKAAYSNNFDNDVSVTIGCESYFIPRLNLLDYNFSVSLIYRGNWRLFKL